MRKTTLFLLAAVVAVSTVFLMGCPTEDDPPATYSKYDRYKFNNQADFNAARANHALITSGALDGSANRPISPVKTYTQYIQKLKDDDTASDAFEYKNWDTSSEPYVFYFNDSAVFTDVYLVDVLKN